MSISQTIQTVGRLLSAPVNTAIAVDSARDIEDHCDTVGYLSGIATGVVTGIGASFVTGGFLSPIASAGSMIVSNYTGEAVAEMCRNLSDTPEEAPESYHSEAYGDQLQSTASHTQDQTDSIDRETNADASKTDQRAAEPARNHHADHGYGSSGSSSWGNDNSGDAQSNYGGGSNNDRGSLNGDSGSGFMGNGIGGPPIVLDLGGGWGQAHCHRGF